MYNLSQDYERLYQLMHEEKDPVCVKGKYLFQFIQDDLEMYFDKESFITYCKDFNLRWIDPQPVAAINKPYEYEHITTKKGQVIWDRAFAAGQASIIEQLKGLKSFVPIGASVSKRLVCYSDIEAIINQSK